MQQSAGENEENELKVAFDASMPRRGAFLYWKKMHLFDFVLAIVVALFALLMLSYGIMNRWFAFAGLGAALFLLTMQLVLFLRHWHHSARLINKLGVNRETWQFSQQGFGVENHLASSKMDWSLLKGVVVADNLWLILFKGGGYALLPVGDASDDALKFRKAKIVEHGGIIK